jgi:hypothetical protein
MIQMSPEQRQSIRQGSPVRLHDPDLAVEVVVCPAALFEEMEARLREFVDDQNEQEQWAETSMQDLSRRMGEDEDG